MRRSPSKSIATLHAAPRLACVKPIASVHPEPGSNSSLFYFFSFFFFSLCSESVLPYQVLPFLTVAFLILVLLVDYVTLSKISLLSQLKRIALPSIAAAKVDTLSLLSKYFCSFFERKFLRLRLTALNEEVTNPFPMVFLHPLRGNWLLWKGAWKGSTPYISLKTNTLPPTVEWTRNGNAHSHI